MKQTKITLAYVSGWDNFDMDRYNNYLKAIQNVESTLSRLHRRSLEDIRKDCESRLRIGGSKDEQSMGEINH